MDHRQSIISNNPNEKIKARDFIAVLACEVLVNGTKRGALEQPWEDFQFIVERFSLQVKHDKDITVRDIDRANDDLKDVHNSIVCEDIILAADILMNNTIRR